MAAFCPCGGTLNAANYCVQCGSLVVKEEVCMKMNRILSVKVEDLRLGDIVRFDTAEFSDGIVKHIKRYPDGGVMQVTVERPYMAHVDFSCSGGENAEQVIAYIGHEDVRLVHGDVSVVKRGPQLK
jgi:hypothetical protein